MNNFKFKVWNKLSKKMFSHEDLENMLKDLTKIQFITGIFLPINSDCEILQYTGKKTIDNKEIYVGDEVEIKFMGPFDEKTFTGVVKFYDGAFWIDNEELERAYPIFREEDELRIIGNIYEKK